MQVYGDLFQLSRHIFRLVVGNTEIFIGKQVCQNRDLLQTKQLVPVHSYVFIIHWSDIPASVQFGNDVAHQLDMRPARTVMTDSGRHAVGQLLVKLQQPAANRFRADKSAWKFFVPDSGGSRPPIYSFFLPVVIVHAGHFVNPSSQMDSSSSFISGGATTLGL